MVGVDLTKLLGSMQSQMDGHFLVLDDITNFIENNRLGIRNISEKLETLLENQKIQRVDFWLKTSSGKIYMPKKPFVITEVEKYKGLIRENRIYKLAAEYGLMIAHFREQAQLMQLQSP